MPDFDEVIGPLDAERAAHAEDLLGAWLAEADRDAARQRFLALKDEWQYLGGERREALLAQGRDGLLEAPDPELKAAALGLLAG